MQNVLSLVNYALMDDSEQGLLMGVVSGCGLTSDISDHC
jgi:hypothetical protein